MSIFNDKALKGVAEAVSKIMDEELKGNQHKIDANKNGKVDAHDFKLLRGKKGMKEAAEKMASKDHDGDGKVESGKAEYLGSRIRAAKASGKLKEEVELDEAFPTVADAKKRMDAGKTATGTVTKTKTGLVHKRDYKDDDDDAEDMQKKSKGYGARQNTGMRGQSDGTKKSMKESKLSFTEMLQLYNEHGVEVISKIVPQTVKFGDTEVELIDANIVNGAVAVQVEEGVMSAVKGAVGVVKDVISKERAYQAQKQVSTGNTLKKLRKEESLSEEPDNETFTKEVEAQKEKNAGRGKKAEVAKASVQAVKQEEVEQIDEISSDLAGKYLLAPQGKGANKYKTGEGTSRYPNADTMSKHGKSVKRALQRADTSSLNKKPSYYKEEEEQLDEVNFADVVARQKEKHGGKLPDKYPAAKKTASNLDVGTSKASKVYSGKPQHKDVFGHDTKSQSAGATGPRASIMQHAHNKIKKFFSKEEYEQIDEVSKKTLGSYIKAASHDVAAKGAFTRHFADKSRAETAAQRPDLARLTMKKADKMQDAGMKRRANMAKAVDRLTKKD